MEDGWFERMNRASRRDQPWYVRWPASIATLVFAMVYVPVFLVITLPVILIALPVSLFVSLWFNVWTRPRMVGRLRRAGRADESMASLERWRAGEGTLIREMDPRSLEVWWTPDVIAPLDADLGSWKPGLTREQAEAFARASSRTAALARQYSDRQSGTAVLLPRITHKEAKALDGLERVIELWPFLARENAQWWHFMDAGWCDACGYYLGGLDAGTVCPECGKKSGEKKTLR